MNSSGRLDAARVLRRSYPSRSSLSGRPDCTVHGADLPPDWPRYDCRQHVTSGPAKHEGTSGCDDLRPGQLQLVITITTSSKTPKWHPAAVLAPARRFTRLVHRLATSGSRRRGVHRHIYHIRQQHPDCADARRRRSGQNHAFVTKETDRQGISRLDSTSISQPISLSTNNIRNDEGELFEMLALASATQSIVTR